MSGSTAKAAFYPLRAYLTPDTMNRATEAVSMSRVAIACAFTLAAVPVSAQDASAEKSRAGFGTSVTDGRPFLFDGLLKRDLAPGRDGSQVDHRRRNSGAMVVEPEGKRPTRE
jgi:hypothetical protein